MNWLEWIWFVVTRRRLPDKCSRCHGRSGGVRGNENLIGGLPVCDYCHVKFLHRREVCSGCGQEIDPDTCGCGLPITHSGWEGHSPIPMGCDCFREKSDG